MMTTQDSKPEILIPPLEAGNDAPNQGMFAVQALLVNLSQVERNHHVARTERHENDAEHTLSVAYLCWFIHDELGLELDMEKVLKYAMAHDIVEVYSGDVNSFASEEAREQKRRDEAEAQARLGDEFKGFVGFTRIMDSYQDKEDGDEEALFVWTVDKVQALIMDDLDSWSAHIRIGITYEAFCSKYKAFIEQCSHHCKEMVEALVEYCIASYGTRLSETGN